MAIKMDAVLGEIREADDAGGTTDPGESSGHGLVACRVFADDRYGQVAWLDDANAMELIGYHVEPVTRLELYLVSANPECSGNIVLTIGGESFTVPAGAAPAKVTLTPAVPLTGIIEIIRDTANPADTLNDGTDPITAFVVDGRWY